MNDHSSATHQLSALTFATAALGWLTPQLVIQGALALGTLLAGCASIGRLIHDLRAERRRDAGSGKR